MISAWNFWSISSGSANSSPKDDMISSTHFLYRAAGSPDVPGALTIEQYQSARRKPASYPPGGPCYLCGDWIVGAALPTSTRLDENWTSHASAHAAQSEWICQPCAFCLSESAMAPGLPRPFKMRCQSHFVEGDQWTIWGLGDKRAMRIPLLFPPPDSWMMAICDSPLAAGHNIFLSPINPPHATSWRIMLGRISIAGAPAMLEYLLIHAEALYALGHGKNAISSGNYIPKLISQSPNIWAYHEAAVAAHRATPLFALAVFLAQKEEDT
jgi:hypothetical protein